MKFLLWFSQRPPGVKQRKKCNKPRSQWLLSTVLAHSSAVLIKHLEQIAFAAVASLDPLYSEHTQSWLLPICAVMQYFFAQQTCWPTQRLHSHTYIYSIRSLRGVHVHMADGPLFYDMQIRMVKYNMVQDIFAIVAFYNCTSSLTYCGAP